MEPTFHEKLAELIVDEYPEYRVVVLIDKPNGEVSSSLVINHPDITSAIHSITNHACEWTNQPTPFRIFSDERMN